MDGQQLIGYLMVLAWLGLLVYMPLADIRRAGSLRVWIEQCLRAPTEAFGTVLIWAGCSAFLLWLITSGAVSVKLALLAPIGFVVILVGRSSRRAP